MSIYVIILSLYNKEDLSMNKKNIDWSLCIPLILWVVCIGFSINKTLQAINKSDLLTFLEVYNGNTFATFMSIVLTLLYNYFNEKKQKKNRLCISRDYIQETIFSTIVYAVLEVINACHLCWTTSIIMTMGSIIYPILFFKIMTEKVSK